MKEENGYKINNPDGADRRGFGEGKATFANDSSHFVRERFDGVSETTRAKESFTSPEAKNTGRRSSSDVGRDASSSASAPRASSAPDVGSASSLTSASGATAAGATATAATTTAATSVTAAVGGGVTAIAGVVTATVVTAVLVVTTFLAVLGVNLSLIMADYTSLTFRLELVTEGEGELEDPYYQAFISGNGVSKSMTVMAGDLFTFDGLEPDKEYLVTIKNGEGEVQVEQTFCTAAHPVQKGSLEVTLSGAEVSCLVKDVPLSSGDFYTVTAKDEKGKVLFVTDDVATEKTFTFTLNTPTKFNVTLSVGGKIQAVAEKEWKEEKEEVPVLLPEYDFDGGVWNWADYLNPTVAFPDKNGGDPLTLSATVTRSEEAPGCEEDGVIRFFATASYEGRTFTDQKTQVVSATGHDYVFMGFEWTPVYSADGAGNTGDEGGVHTSDAGSDGVQTGDEVPATIVGYTAAAVFVCSHDETHVVTVTEGVTVTSTDSSPTCEADAFRRFTASFTQEGETYTDTQDLVFEGTARGHDYSLSDPYATTEFDWTVEQNGTCSAAYLVVTCANGCGKTHRVDAELGMESPDEAALCTRGGSITYYASVYYNENLYQDVKEVSVEALGHVYDSYLWIWAEDGGPCPYMEFTCSRCGEKDYCNVDSDDITQNAEGKYVATATYNGVTYTDVSDETISLSDGTLFLRSYDYTQGEDVGATPFFGSNMNRIILTGSYSDEKPALEIYNFSDTIDGVEGRGDGSAINFFIDFDNVDISVAEDGGSPIHIIATKNVVLFIENKGTSQLSYYDAPLITVEGDSECSVTVYVQSTNGFNGFVCTEQNDGWSYLFDAESAVSVSFFMNEEQVDFDGEPIQIEPIG